VGAFGLKVFSSLKVFSTSTIEQQLIIQQISDIRRTLAYIHSLLGAVLLLAPFTQLTSSSWESVFTVYGQSK
jgi:hypothetical protein